MRVTNGNGSSFWQTLSKVLIGALITIVMGWVACVHRELDQVRDRQERDAARAMEVRDQARESAAELKRELEEARRTRERIEQYGVAAARVELRLLRVEMKLDQIMRAENIRQPRGLPDMPEGE